MRSPPSTTFDNISIAFGQKEFLYQQVAGREQDASSLMDEGLRDGTKQMGFPATPGPEGEHIFRAVEEGTPDKA